MTTLISRLTVTPQAQGWDYGNGLVQVFDPGVSPDLERTHHTMACEFVQVEDWGTAGAPRKMPSRLRVEGPSADACRITSCTGGVPPPPDIRTNAPYTLAIRMEGVRLENNRLLFEPPAGPVYVFPRAAPPTTVLELAAQVTEAMGGPPDATVVHLYWVANPTGSLPPCVLAIPVAGQALPTP